MENQPIDNNDPPLTLVCIFCGKETKSEVGKTRAEVAPALAHAAVEHMFECEKHVLRPIKSALDKALEALDEIFGCFTDNELLALSKSIRSAKLFLELKNELESYEQVSGGCPESQADSPDGQRDVPTPAVQ